MKVIDFKDAKCRHCYKCVRHCAVKAITVRDEQARIMVDHCINCGRCLEVCPQNAKTFVSDLDRVKYYIRNGEKVVISMAPSYLGILSADHPGKVVGALEALGFYAVRETAEGAAYVTAEYAKLLAEGTMDNIITTCCPSVNDLVEKYYPALTPYLAPVVSPMVAHGRLIKKLYGPEVKVVFLGPCVAKKEEAEGDERTAGAIDAVIHFGELKEWMAEKGIALNDCPERPLANPDPGINRLYPVSHGVIQSVMVKKAPESYRKLFVDGIDNCREMLDAMERGEIHGCFIEMNMCEGGCIKGPAVEKMEFSRFRARFDIEDKVQYTDAAYPEGTPEVEMAKHFYSRMADMGKPTEAQIQAVLKATGKYNKDQELNCGACGYPTCRDKAIAVCQGKAEIQMCLPYTYEQAKSMSNLVMDTTPNLIFIIRNDLMIEEFNRKAEAVFQISRNEAIGRYIYEFLDPEDFETVLLTHDSIHRKKEELPAWNMTALKTIVYIESRDALLTIIQDITAEEQEAEKQFQLKMQTLTVAQQVIDKQMMVAQEIAGLLGETTAETKMTLTKMRDSIIDDGDDE